MPEAMRERDATRSCLPGAAGSALRIISASGPVRRYLYRESINMGKTALGEAAEIAL